MGYIEDSFRDSLQTLDTTDAVPINTLTEIAQENQDTCAQGIAEILVEHIKSQRTPSKQMVPTIYLLDSIIKNVQEPYARLFGRCLYQTFMKAYSRSSQSERRTLIQTLSSWSEKPSLFPAEHVKGIFDALARVDATVRKDELKDQNARSGATRQTHGLPPRPPITPQQLPVPNTALPHAVNNFAPPNPNWQNGAHGPRNSTPVNQQTVPHSMYNAPPGTYVPPTPPQYHPPPAPPYPMQNDSNERFALIHKVSELITQTQHFLYYNSQDMQAFQRLQRLQEIHRLLEQGHLKSEQLNLIKTNLGVSSLIQAPVSNAQPPNLSAWSSPPHQPSFPAVSAGPAPVAASITPSGLTPFNLPASAPIPHLPHAPPIPTISASTTPQPSATPDIGDLLYRIRAGNSATPTNRVTSTPLTPKKSSNKEDPRKKTNWLTTAFIQTPNRSRINKAYKKNPIQCLRCARRFPSTSDGKTRKRKHLDHHFQLNKRRAAASASSQHSGTRRWYVDAPRWIESVEVDEADPLAEQKRRANSGDGDAGNGEDDTERQKKYYVRVTAETARKEPLCYSCRDPLRATYLAEENTFVFADAVAVGDKYLHRECRDDLRRKVNRGAGVLGKHR